MVRFKMLNSLANIVLLSLMVKNQPHGQGDGEVVDHVEDNGVC
jgi:hypothetical protein